MFVNFHLWYRNASHRYGGLWCHTFQSSTTDHHMFAFFRIPQISAQDEAAVTSRDRPTVVVVMFSRSCTVWCNEIGSLTSLMHVTLVHPVTAENQFHCTRLYAVVLSANMEQSTICREPPTHLRLLPVRHFVGIALSIPTCTFSVTKIGTVGSSCTRSELVRDDG